MLAIGGRLLELALNEYKAAKTELEQHQAFVLANSLLEKMEDKYKKNRLLTGVSGWCDEYTPTDKITAKQSWRTALYGKPPEIAWLVVESRSGDSERTLERGFFTPPGGAGQLVYQQALYAGQKIVVSDQNVPPDELLSNGLVIANGVNLLQRSYQSCVLPMPEWTAYTRGVGWPNGIDWQADGGLSGQIYNGALATPKDERRFYDNAKIDGDGVFVNRFSIRVGENVAFSGHVCLLSQDHIFIQDHACLQHAFLYARSGIVFGDDVVFSGVAVTPSTITVGSHCRISKDAMALKPFCTSVMMNGKELVFWN